jgi:hypothetical protein
MMLLRPISLSLLVACAACGTVPADPPATEESSGTGEPADSSSGGVSVTSTTGVPPGTSTSTTVDPSATGGTSDDTSDDTGFLFLLEPDGGSCVQGRAPEGFQLRCSYCDVGLQDCPDGDKCVPWDANGDGFWDHTRCSPIPEDPAGVGEPCVAEDSPVSGFDDCDIGALCFGVDPRTLQGTCTALCDPNQPDACGADQVCVDYDYFQPYVCLGRCDPLDPAACAKDEACRPIGDDTLCVPTVTLPQGLDCGVDDQYCAPGEACLWADQLASCADPQCCRPWCDLSAPDPDLPCAVPGEVCRPFDDSPPTGLEHLGVCGLPL